MTWLESAADSTGHYADVAKELDAMRWETTAATPEDMKKLQQAQRNHKTSE